MKTYCMNCKHYTGSDSDGDKLCWSQKKRDYFGFKIGEFCKEKNKNNNCSDFEKSWLKKIVNKAIYNQ